MKDIRPARWWLGVPALAVLWAATCWWLAPAIDKLRLPREPDATAALVLVREGERILMRGSLAPDTRAAIEAALRQAGFAGEIAEQPAPGPRVAAMSDAIALAAITVAQLASGEAALTAQGLSVTGRASRFEGYNAIRDSVASAAASGIAARFDVTPPEAAPFVWAAERRGETIELSGFVPSEAARAAVRGEAARILASLSLVDRMQTAGGLSQGLAFEEAARFALQQLARLGSGRAELDGRELALTGATQERDVLAAIGETMRATLPAGLVAGAVSLTPLAVTPYVMAARRGQGLLTLSGYVPDEAARRQVLDVARRAFLTEQIVDALHLGDGAPPSFLAGAGFGLEQLAQLATGEATLSATTLAIAGTALYRQSAEQTRSRILGSAPAGWRTSAAITVESRERVLEPDLCDELLGEAGQRDPVQFEAKKATLPPGAEQRLGAIAALAKRCGGVPVRVAVQSESGDAAGGALSRARTDIVIAALTRAGIDSARLRAAAPVEASDKAKAGLVTIAVER